MRPGDTHRERIHMGVLNIESIELFSIQTNVFGHLFGLQLLIKWLFSFCHAQLSLISLIINNMKTISL